MKTSLFRIASLVALLVALCLLGLTVAPEQSLSVEWYADPMFSVHSLATVSPTGLSPAQIRQAYNLPALGGSGTIAIIDAYDCPTVQSDFAVFSSQFGLPSTNLEVHKMASSISVDAGWTLEISLDVQWAHAVAPNASILLVEARSNSLGDLLSAVNYATSRSDVVAVSMSWGSSEFLFETMYDYYFGSAGKVFFASSGDNGSGVIWPSTSPNVVAVGGTRLNLNPNGTVSSETAWSGSGGGISAYESMPAYQVSYGLVNSGSKREAPDVSYDADPVSGVSVYDSTPYNGQSGWWRVGGTSAGAPQWAGIHSLGLSTSNNNFYQDAKANSPAFFRDITSGSNGAYYATVGYDLVTGLGSPVTWNFTPGAGLDFSMSASPSALTIRSGSSGSSNITASSINGFAGSVSLAASGPAGWNSSFNPFTVAVPLGGSNSSVLTLTVSNTTSAGIYNVTVVGSSGSLSHNVVLPVTVQTVPSAPRNLTASVGNSQIILNWSAPLDSGGLAISNYSIYKGTVSGSESKIASISGGVLSYVDSAVTGGQVYFYQVSANNSIGESARSNEANATLPLRNMNITVSTDRANYFKWSYVAINVTAIDSANSSALQGAVVNVTVNDPHGKVAWTGSGTTDLNGRLQLTYKLVFNALMGTYNVTATVVLNGYQTGTGQTTFYSLG